MTLARGTHCCISLSPPTHTLPQVCIPTTSGTGSEVTPFSVVTDEQDGAKYPLADYALTPNMVCGPS